ncbi:hypothetical protein C8F04DRAFT_1235053 [Mycena alexandri]|uniref:Uncharacterized protein n=1 Tax=Mycena alexandri TaxID=1745969 RepID=A0AAD6SRR8_9AGAR|nr:hypothetical protein C8F04DRAFT_1235053 [Mycena alexandri]
MASTNPTARPAKAPPMTSMPSTPGPDIPGGYPRNSTVFASNQWDRSEKSKPGLFAAAKNYLPPAVASYLPKSSATSSTPAPTSPNTLSPPPINRESSAVSEGFSTRAYAGSGSSRDTPLATPLPSDFPSPPTADPVSPHDAASRALSHNPYFPPAPGVGATTVESPVSVPVPVEEKEAEKKEVIPIPTVAPSASILASTGKSTTSATDVAPIPVPADKLSPVSAASASTSSTNSNANSTFSGTPPSAVSTAPSSPASPKSAGSTKKPQFVLSPLAGTPPDSPKSGSSKFASTLARLGSRRSRAGPKSGAPPSAFNAGSGHARTRSEGDAAGAVGATEFGANAGATSKTNGTPKRSGSLLRTLRGEATVLAGRMRRDQERVERGKRMMDGAEV